MPDFYKGDIPILDDFGSRRTDLTHPKDFRMGLTPRDYGEHPEEMLAGPDTLQVIDRSEWDARYDEQEANESSLEHLFLRGGKPAFVSLDQNGHGYCWSYSTGTSLMLARLRNGLPLVRLNPHSVAAIIKGGRDEGGWCGLSMKFVAEHGMAAEGGGPGEWPLHSRNLTHDTPATRAAMAKNKVLENVYDLTRREWDQQLTAAQLATCGFLNVPCPSDFNWWGHSVCQVRWVRVERGSWGPLILNSWKGWGRHGLAVLRGSQATANGAVATRTASLSGG
jgi:hypothetical protein